MLRFSFAQGAPISGAIEIHDSSRGEDKKSVRVVTVENDASGFREVDFDLKRSGIVDVREIFSKKLVGFNCRDHMESKEARKWMKIVYEMHVNLIE